MVDCNQQWSMPRAIEFGERSRNFNLFWIEEPTHPDDTRRARSPTVCLLAPRGLGTQETAAQISLD